jgi:general stress protein YciG
MPNNNPRGHNQYSSRKEQMEHGAGALPSDTPPPVSTAAAPGGTSAGPARRGFAAMDEATQRTIASKGGQSQGKDNNPGNFANDRDRAREAGRKGGEAHGTHRQ